MDRTLFMANQDMSDIRPRQFVINIQNRPTGITKDGIHAFFL
jgi:hypothetical protein